MRHLPAWIAALLLALCAHCHPAHAGAQDGPDGVDPLGIFAPIPTTFTPKYYVTQEVSFEHIVIPEPDPGIPWCAGPNGQTSQQIDAVCRDLCKTRNTSKLGCVLFDAEGSRTVTGDLSCKCTWLCMPQLKYYQ